MATEFDTGDAALTSGGSEVVLNATTPGVSDGKFQLWLDFATMAEGDVIEIRLKEKVRSGGTQRQAEPWTVNNSQASPAWVSDEFVLLHGWDFTLKQTAGTSRTIPYSIRRATPEAADIQALILSDATPFPGASLTEARLVKLASLTFTGANKVDASLRDWLGTAPSALISGRVDANAQAMGTDALTSGALATTAVNEIRDAILSDSTPFPGARVDVAISTRAVAGDAMTLAANAITNAVIATDAIGAAELAADAVTEINAAVLSAVAALNNLSSAQAQTAADAALQAKGYTATRATKLDNADAAVSTRSSHTAADIWSVTPRTLTGFGTLIADIWAYLTSSIATSGSIGKLVKDNLDAKVSEVPAAVDTLVTSEIVSQVQSVLIDDFASIPATVWDEARAGHVASGSFGQALDDRISTVRTKIEDAQNDLTSLLVLTAALDARVPPDPASEAQLEGVIGLVPSLAAAEVLATDFGGGSAITVAEGLRLIVDATSAQEVDTTADPAGWVMRIRRRNATGADGAEVELIPLYDQNGVRITSSHNPLVNPTTVFVAKCVRS